MRHPVKKSTTDMPRRLELAHIVITDPRLPALTVPVNETPAENLFDTGNSASSSHGGGAWSGSDAGEPVIASHVDKPAVARDDNPIPKYPSVLESSRVEGSVLVEFVVDTLGKAEMSTLRILESSNDLFVRAFAATLPRWRFYPAETGGRKVKQVVQLPLKFIAPHR